MPSSCPKCHAVLDEDEICCAQVRYTWRCKSCFKVASGFTIPYGKCHLCGGDLELIPDRELGDSMRFRAIHDVIQFELTAFRFFKLAREKAATPEKCTVLEHLSEAELDRLHELEERYHAHLDCETAEFTSEDEKRFSDWLFRGILVKDDAEIADLYKVALEVERRAREHFRNLAGQLPAGLENELAREVAAEEDEQIAMLETELEQIA